VQGKQHMSDEKLNRRQFFSQISLLSAGGFIDEQTLDNVEALAYKQGLSILQGFTDETTAQFTVDLPRFTKVHYEVLDPQTGIRVQPIKVSTAQRNYSLYRVDKVIFTGLYLNAGFLLIVKDQKNKILDQRKFKTLDTQSRTARIAMMSCMFEYNPKQGQMWRLAGSAQPDVIFFLGDNIYGDWLSSISSPEVLWYRYIHSRRTIRFYRQENLVPTIAIWDDHDFGANNVGGSYKHKANSTRTFNEFYAQEPIGPAFSRGPGISSAFTAFGRKFIFLDGRSFRGLPTPTYKSGFFGDEQLNWLAEEMNSFSGPVFLLSGSQFFGAYRNMGESYERKGKHEFQDFCQLIASHQYPCVFGSGDVHYSEVMKIESQVLGYSSFELTSSSMHSVPRLNPDKNFRRLDGAVRENFLLVDLAEETGRQKVQSLGLGRGQIFGIDLDTET